LRLGFRQVDGFRKDWADEIVRVRTTPFASIEDLARRANLPQRAMNLLADADAFRSVAKERREALWDVRRTPPKQLALFAAAEVPELGAEPDAHLPAMPLSEQVAADYQTTRLSLKAHPMQFLRARFAAEGILSSAQANATKDGRRAKVAGVVLVRQRPGKGNAIFVTIEDETGITNGLMWARDFEANRRAVMASRLMVLEGVIQRSEEGVTHLMTSRVQDRTEMLRLLSEDHALEPPLARTIHGRRILAMCGSFPSRGTFIEVYRRLSVWCPTSPNALSPGPVWRLPPPNRGLSPAEAGVQLGNAADKGCAP
jgi:error-prone DNA polymerase